MKDGERYLVGCQCGCGVILFEADKEEDEVWISFYPNGYYATQCHFLDRLKLIWNVIIGKHYREFDILAKYSEFENILTDSDNVVESD